jgi:predicted alpha/beta-hydrolase family hydrolase
LVEVVPKLCLYDPRPVHVLDDGPRDAAHTLILAHGAGGPMDVPFMTRIARGVAEHGIRVIRFEFHYMRRRRESGRRGGAPDRQPVLMEAWRDVIRAFPSPKLFIGGKSLGGRIASMVADDAGVAGLICLGYPFHPPNNPAKLRTDHLRTLRTPALIIQGERDPFGTRDEVTDYALASQIRFEWLPDGDHSFKPRASSGVREMQNLERAVAAAAAFIRGQD